MEKTAKYLLVTILILSLISIAAIVVCSSIDLFTVENIQIIKNVKFDDNYFISGISGYVEENGFKTLFKNIDSAKGLLYAFALRDYNAEKKFIAENPYIRNVKVNFVPPDGVKIEVYERQESYKVEFLEMEILVSRDFVVLGECYGIKLPKITGLDFRTYEKGRELEISQENKEALNEIYENSVYKGRSLADKIAEIRFGKELIIVMGNGIEVIFGSSDDIEYKMKCLSDIYYEYLHEYSGGELDLSNRDKKVYRPG